MRRYSIIILRLALLLFGVVILALCYGATRMITGVWETSPNQHLVMIVMLASLYLTALSFGMMLYQGMKLLGYIHSNRAFSILSVEALKKIMWCGLATFVVCTLGGLPVLYYWAEKDDAPGLILIGLALAGGAFVVTVFASILLHLLQEAIHVKSEMFLMKRVSIILMRYSVFLAGLLMILICIGVPWIAFTEGKSATGYDVDNVLIILTLGIYAAAIPYFMALYQTLKLLIYIDKNGAFTELSVQALKKITHYAIADFLICLFAGAPFFLILGRNDGNPGMVLFGLIPAGIALLIAVFASLLKGLLSDAITEKTENDWIV